MRVLTIQPAGPVPVVPAGLRSAPLLRRPVENDANPELTLIGRIVSGERHLFHELVRPYERRVYLAAVAILRNEADAEDAAQDALLKAFTHLHQFRAEARFSTWLISIAINEARHRLRGGKHRQAESLDAEPEERSFSPAVLADWREVPLASLEQMELRQMLRDAVLELPEIYRGVFTARDIDGLNTAETALAFGVSDAAVKVRLHRARMMLQRRLAPLLEHATATPKRRFPWF